MRELDSNNSFRLFFALWPDEHERAALGTWQPPLLKLCGGRATAAEQLHNTLVFLGRVPCARLLSLQLAAQEVKAAAFQLSFDVARYWGHNRIVYAAPLKVAPRLNCLVSELAHRLRQHGFKTDTRPYQPHVTLLRRAHWSDNALPGFAPVTWNVGAFALVQSQSVAQGVRYEVLKRFALAEY